MLIGKYLVIPASLSFALTIHAQKIANIRFEQTNRIINIYYDLMGDNTNKKYTIDVYCSTDGGLTWGMPLQNVTGFVGSDQIPDINKKITWDFLTENEKLEGNLVFDVKIKDAYNETNTTTKTTLVANTSTFTDPRDKQVYKWIKIGNQIWMAENLNYELDKDCFCYEYSSANCNTYGRLYTWDAAIKSCPTGWHLPSRLEWATLLKFLGDANSVGGYLKEADISHWREPNMGASDFYGFKARPGGWVTGQPYYFREIGILGCWWASTIASENKKGQAFSHGVMLEYNSSRFFLNYVKPNYFRQSVRCIKD